MSERRRCVHYLVAVFVFLNDLADFVCDWLFFIDVQLMKPGLVYGPTSSSVWWAILIFSIIGTFLFIAEAANLYFETTKDKAWVDSDILSLIVVWIEDVPQVAISLHLVLCREEAISVFQLAKAVVVLLGTFIRLVQVGVKYFRKGSERHRHHLKIKIVIFIGMLLQFACSIAVVVLSYTTKTDSGISLQVPKKLIEETFDDRKYFANVSVFVNHAEYFDFGGLRIPDRDRVGENQGDPVINWMRLTSIDHVMAEGRGDGLHFSLEYETNPSAGVLNLAWWAQPKAGGKGSVATPLWTTSGCYTVNQSHGTVSEGSSDCTRSSGFFTANSNRAYITFGYTEPGVFFRRQTFGDITFNMRLDSNDAGGRACREVQDYTSSLEANNAPATLRFHYFQTAAHIPPLGTHHFLTDDSQRERIRFFRNDGRDMKEIKEVWQTGWRGCDSTGSLAPTLNTNLEVSCSRTA